MIPTVTEPPSVEWWAVEECYFKCGNHTRDWHWRTNQPVCKECQKTRKVGEIEKSSPTYKPLTKEQYIKAIQ